MPKSIFAAVIRTLTRIQPAAAAPLNPSALVGAAWIRHNAGARDFTGLLVGALHRKRLKPCHLRMWYMTPRGAA